MNAKQQAIKAAIRNAWGDYYHDNLNIDENGWIPLGEFGNDVDAFTRHLDYVFPDITIEMELSIEERLSVTWIRPKSLISIETNRGWHRIDGPDDLPKIGVVVDFFREGISGFRYTGIHIGEGIFKDSSGVSGMHYNDVTHWRPVEEVPEPVY